MKPLMKRVVGMTINFILGHTDNSWWQAKMKALNRLPIPISQSREFQALFDKRISRNHLTDAEVLLYSIDTLEKDVMDNVRKVIEIGENNG